MVACSASIRPAQVSAGVNKNAKNERAIKSTGDDLAFRFSGGDQLCWRDYSRRCPGLRRTVTWAPLRCTDCDIHFTASNR